MGETIDKATIPILVVDDSSTMRRIMRLTLGRCGYNTVEEAQNGVEGLAKATQKQFGCVITDWNMPEMDGLEMTKAIRKLPNYASIPIMMVTTEGGKQEVVEALMQGVNSYIVKPFTEALLAEKMQSLFGN
ncbi:MAG: response regulator [Lentisphaerota bacterium]